ncbi:MAG: restriction endonuclease subunit S [Natronohydrobacter sp.]|nr:restriction endonuclease subunit S [Natronohydrobacter sp.]
MASLSRGKFSARPRNDPRFFGGDIPFVQTGDVRNAHVYLRDFTQTLNGEGLKVSRVFPKGTMLFTIAANIGDLAFLSFDAACPDSLVAIEPKQDTDAVWLFYQLGAFKADFEAAATQNAQLNINLEKLNPFKIPVPPLHEQQAIAAALSDADGVVAGLERVIAKKRLIKQGAMQDLLTARRRLAGWGDPTSEHVKVPKGWINVALSMLADFRTGPFGSTFHKSDYKRGGVPLINPSHIVDGEIIPDEAIAVSPDLAHKLSVFALQENDIVIGRRGEMGRCAVVTNQHVGFLCGTGSMIVRPKENGNSQLLRAYLASRAVIEKIEESSVGTTMINLNQTTLSSLELMVPEEPKEQQAIAAVLSDMDAEIQTLESRLTKARAIKEGMMQNLLTGRVRLV